MINVKELMIGDYVDVTGHGNPIERGIVKEIYNDKITIALKDCDGIFAGNEISPIGLTEEFFIKNGFEAINENFSWLFKNTTAIVKIIHRNCSKCEIYGINIKYVHEFQHFLRLVNLQDYANLKIE